MQKIIFIITSLFLFTLRAEAAMVRVIGIENGRTITIDDRGTRVSVQLAGVVITDELRARELLRWTIGGAWVMLEDIPEDIPKDKGGAALVYRSPDALFINRELVLRGCARATLPGIEPENRPAVTYLGEINPEGPQRDGPQRGARSAAPAPGSGSGTRRRPRASPTPAGRSRSSRTPGAEDPSAPHVPPSGARTRAPRSPRSSG
jgi:hypothetical protein